MAYKKIQNTNVETEINDEVKTEEKTVYTDFDMIPCHSVWFGGLNITCPSGNSYNFSDYGSPCDISYRDLINLIRKNSEHIFLPRFVIDDDEFLKDFPTIKRVYADMYTTSDLVEILKLPNAKMKAEIEKLPIETKNVLCKMIATEIASGRLDSISKVRILGEMFDSDFDLISKLFVK